MTFERALELVLEQEGGYVDDPADSGGATNFGVTQRTYDAWRTARGQPHVPVRDIQHDEVRAIYEREYWLAARCDRMPWPLSLIHFDCAVNAGLTAAAKQLQRALEVKDDGIVGPVTLARCAPAGPRDCYRYLLERVFFYRALALKNATQTKFLAGGWLGRLKPLYQEVGI